MSHEEASNRSPGGEGAGGPSGGGAPGTTGPSGGFSASQSWKRTLIEVGIALAFLGLVVLGVRGCAGFAAAGITRALPAQVDAALGKSGGEAMRARYGAGAAPKSEQVERVERVFGELRAALSPEEAAVLIAPRVTTVVDEQVNAFALPGGEVFVLTGLLDRVGEDDDMLRGVLAHELGHAVHRHGVRGLVRSGVYGLVLSYVLGDIDAVTGFVVAGASKLDELDHSRAMEDEADEFGVKLLKRAGKSPEGMARFMESLESAPVPELLSTHPDSGERAKRIRELMKEP